MPYRSFYSKALLRKSKAIAVTSKDSDTNAAISINCYVYLVDTARRMEEMMNKIKWSFPSNFTSNRSTKFSQDGHVSE